MKTVTVFTTWFDSHGGAEKALRKLMSELSKIYFLRIVVLNPEVKESYFEQRISARITRINSRTHKLLRSFSVPSLKNLISIVRRTRSSDCIFVHQYYTFSSFLGALCSRVYGIPMVVKPIAPIPTDYPPTSFLLRMLGRIANRTVLSFVLKQSSVIVPTSNYEKKYLEHLGISSKKFHIVPSGIDIAFFGLKNRAIIRERFRRSHKIPLFARVVLYAGRIHEMKGLDQVVLALPSLLQSCNSVYFVLVGKSEPVFLNKLKKMAQDCKVWDRVIFLGYLEGSDLVECYSSADVFVNPSYMEAAPLAVREALAVGLPVVATNVGGTAEFLDSDQVKLIPQGDSAKLSAALADVLQNGRKSAHRSTIVSWETYVDMMKQIFEEVCNRRNISNRLEARVT